MNDLIGAENVGRGYTSARGADVERFCELDEFGPGCVCRAQEDWHLQANARGPSQIRGMHALTILQKISLHDSSLSTRELVRK